MFCEGFCQREWTEEVEIAEGEFVGSTIQAGMAKEELKVFFEDALLEENV